MRLSAALALLMGLFARPGTYALPSPRQLSGAPGDSVNRMLYGLHSDVTWYKDSAYRARSIAAAHALHAQVLRIQLSWMWIEYAEGHRNWHVMDDVVRQIVMAGMRPLIVVSGSPPWANHVPEEQDKDFYLYVPTDTAQFRRWVIRYAAFVADAAQRYKGQVSMWEIGNEPNDADFWRPAPNVDQYATWYIALRSSIKKIDPSALVASGGLNGLGYEMDPPGMRGTAFLKALYMRHVYPDIVAIHPYSNRGQSPDSHIARAGNFDDIALVHQLMTSYGQSQTPIWVTEWGWSIDRVTPAQQAAYLQRSLARLRREYSRYVTLAVYYSEFDPSPVYHYGLYTKDLTLRPAGMVFREFMDRESIAGMVHAPNRSPPSP